MSELQTPHVPWKTCDRCFQKYLYADECASCKARGRIGDFMQCASGRIFWPLDPRPEEIFVNDIAHHLAQQNRFAGACLEPYSVAEHSVRVSWRTEQVMKERNESVTRTRAAALLGLLHDSAETYLVDLPRPVKHSMPDYLVFEAKLESVIADRFNLNTEFWPIVKQSDEEVCETERRDLLAPCERPWRLALPPLPEKIKPWSWVIARERFLFRFHTLTDGDDV